MATISLPTTAAEQLEALLPWLNGDQVPRPRINAALNGLLSPWMSGDAELDAAMRDDWREMSDAHINRLRLEMRQMLNDTMPLVGDARGEPVRVSLAFQLTPRRRVQAKVSAMTARDRRAARARNKGTMLVGGSLRDLAVYRFVRLLEPGAILLSRCAAPAADDADQKCGRWFVAAARRPGRPATFCSATCRVRHHRRNR